MFGVVVFAVGWIVAGLIVALVFGSFVRTGTVRNAFRFDVID